MLKRHIFDTIDLSYDDFDKHEQIFQPNKDCQGSERECAFQVDVRVDKCLLSVSMS